MLAASAITRPSITTGITTEPILAFLNTPAAVVVTLAHAYAVFAILPIYVALQTIPRSLLEAASDLGAHPFAVFRKVILPMSMPGVLAAALVVFVSTVGDYVTPSLVGGPSSTMIGSIIQAQFGIQAAAREGANVGANVSSSINTYDRSLDAATLEANLVLTEYGLNPTDATLTFPDNDPILRRGTFFQMSISYVVTIPAPTIAFFKEISGDDGTTFTVRSTSVIPIQLHKARWPCPSPDPICS